MKEFRLVTGHQGRRWHGSEIVTLQDEALAVLHGMFETIGPCVISGCSVAGSSIAAGIVSIGHTDGWKVVRFAGAGSLTFPVYLVVTKTSANKLYDDNTNQKAFDNYTASLVTVQPSSGSYLKFEATGAVSYKDKLTGAIAVNTMGSLTAIKFDKNYVELDDPQSTSSAITYTYNFTNAVVGSKARIYLGADQGGTTLTFPAGTIKAWGMPNTFTGWDGSLVLEFTYLGMDTYGSRVVTVQAFQGI